MANVQGEGSIKGLPGGAKAEITTIRRFIELLEAADILPKADLEAIKTQLPEAKRDLDAADVARKLVAQNVLTKHQAASLYQQRPKSLGLASYIFLDRLGTGGSGSVFKAKQRKTGQIVAVKVLNLTGSRSPDALKRFQREFETAARLNHPHIVRALESGEAGGQYFTAMEYIEGTDLSTYVKKSGPLPWEQAAQCVVTAARALSHAHEQGIIHRDIKPANLMLCTDGKIKVLDMGLARLQDPAAEGNDQAAEGLTQTGQVMGTVDYMAPEQALHTRLADARADVYSLGCTLYRLVTGDIPYDGDSMVAKILSHRETPIPSMRKKNPKVPASADIVLQKMLAKKPEDRYQTMVELADELERCTQGYDIAPLSPPANLTATTVKADVDSRSNSLTIGITTKQTQPAGEAAPLRPLKRRRMPVWVPVLGGVLVMAAAGGVAWKLNEDRFAANNPPEIVQAIPPAEAPPTPSPTPSASMPASLPSSTGASPTGLASGTVRNSPPTVVVNNTPTHGTTGASPTDERGAAVLALNKGFTLVIYDFGTSQSREVRTIQELPPVNFAVMAILTPSPNLSVDDLLARISAAKSLSGLSFRGAILPPAALAQLNQYPKLQTIIFNESSLDDAQLKAIDVLMDLRQLELSRTRTTEAALDVVARQANLLHLNLGWQPITDAGLAKLGGMTGLVTLNLENCRLTDAAVATLSNLTKLQSLTIRGTQITPDGRNRLAAALPGCRIDPPPAQMSLALSRPNTSGGPSTVITPAMGPQTGGTTGAPSVASYPAPNFAAGYAGERDLANWCFQQGYRINIYLPSVPTFTQTVSRFEEIPPGDFAVIGIYLNSTRPLTKAVFDKLATAPFLTGFYSYNSGLAVDPGAWQYLAQLPRLHALAVPRSQFNDADAAVLRSLPELRFLDCSSNQMTDAGLGVVAALPQLQYLNLSGLPITEVGVAKLANCPSLRRLHLGGTRVSDTAIAALSSLKSVLSINLTGTPLTQEGRLQLKTAMPTCDVYSSTWYGFNLPRPTPEMIAAAVRAATPGAVPNGTGTETSVVSTVNTAPQPLGTAMPLGTGQPSGVAQTTDAAQTPASFEAKKLPVPTAEQLEPSLKLIREDLFKDQYAAAKKPEERVTLAAELLGQAKDLGDDTNGMYAMLREARDMAADGGDITLAISACGNAEQRFTIDALEWLAEACEASVKKTQARTVSRAMAEGLAPKVDEAVAAQKYAVAERLLDAALAAARKSLDANLTKQLVERDKTFAGEKRQFEEVTAARKTLEEKPDDPAANLALGKYECFVTEEWDEGIKHLAKGSDPILKGLAEKSTGTTNAEITAAGDAWWTQAQKLAKNAQKDYLIGALHFYEASSAQLTGLERTRVDKRIADARTFLGDAAPKPKYAPLTGTTGIASAPSTVPAASGALNGLLNADQQRFAAFIFSLNGGVVVEATSQSGSSTSWYVCNNDADIQRYAGRIRSGVIGISMYGSRGARCSESDLRSICSAKWLRRMSFDSIPLTNAGISALAGLPELEYLFIVNAPQVTDVGLAFLSRNARLNSLTMNGTGITGSAFANLQNLPLNFVQANQTPFNDAGMAAIAQLPNLLTLYLDDTQITDAGIAKMSTMFGLGSFHAARTKITGATFPLLRNLDSLYLDGTQINDNTLRIISQMQDLDFLHVENTQVSDTGIGYLSVLPNLNTLYVTGCQRVTDKIVPTIVRFPNLSAIYIRQSGITPNGAQAIRSQSNRIRVEQ